MGCQVQPGYGQDVVHSCFFCCCLICRPVIVVAAVSLRLFLSSLVDVMYVTRRTQHPRPLGLFVALTVRRPQQDFTFFNSIFLGERKALAHLGIFFLYRFFHRFLLTPHTFYLFIYLCLFGFFYFLDIGPCCSHLCWTVDVSKRCRAWFLPAKGFGK